MNLEQAQARAFERMSPQNLIALDPLAFEIAMKLVSRLARVRVAIVLNVIERDIKQIKRFVNLPTDEQIEQVVGAFKARTGSTMTDEEFQRFMREGFDAQSEEEAGQIIEEAKIHAEQVKSHDPALACLLDQVADVMERMRRHVTTNYNADGSRRDPKTKPS